MYPSAVTSQRQNQFRPCFSDQLEVFRSIWKRSVDAQFICGLPGKEYELWTHVSLRVAVLDGIREGRLKTASSSEVGHLALGKNIYKALPLGILRALSILDFTDEELRLNAERAESEFASLGAESGHILVLSSRHLNNPIKLFDCVIGSAATDVSVAFLSEVHQVDLSHRMSRLTMQTAFGFTNIQDGQLFEIDELYGLSRG